MQDEAWRDAAARYRDMVWRVACNACSHRQDAEDITQETFLRFLGTRDVGDMERHIAYLYTIARNLCVDFYRARQDLSLDQVPPPAQHPEEAQAFLDYLISDTADAIFEGVGFTPMA